MCTASTGSNKWAKRIRWASETRRNRDPSPVEAPGATLLDGLDTGLVVPVQEFVGDLARRRFVGELHCGVAEPPDADHCDRTVSEDALHGCVYRKIFPISYFVVQKR